MRTSNTTSKFSHHASQDCMVDSDQPAAANITDRMGFHWANSNTISENHRSQNARLEHNRPHVSGHIHTQLGTINVSFVKNMGVFRTNPPRKTNSLLCAIYRSKKNSMWQSTCSNSFDSGRENDFELDKWWNCLQRSFLIGGSKLRQRLGFESGRRSTLRQRSSFHT